MKKCNLDYCRQCDIKKHYQLKKIKKFKDNVRVIFKTIKEVLVILLGVALIWWCLVVLLLI